MKIKSILFFGFLIYMFYSCSKSSPQNDIQPPIVVPQTNDNTYLSKIYDIEMHGATIDTVNLVTYNFDNEKRVIEITDSTNFSAPYTRQKFYYNGAGRLPYKSTIRTTYDPTLYDSTTCLYTYNAQDKLIDNLFIRDNITYPADTVKYHYSYSAGNIYANFYYSFYGFPSRQIILTKDTATLNSAGNIFSCVNHTSSNSVVRFYTYTFDNNPSPYLKLTSNQAFYILQEGGGYFWEFPQTNNWLVRTISSTGTTPSIIDYTGGYTYNTLGYPTQILYTNSGIVYKKVFVYKAL